MTFFTLVILSLLYVNGIAWLISRNIVSFQNQATSGSVSRVCQKPLRSLRMTDDNKKSAISDKLVFDTKTGRFYERKLEEICDEEFCLVDPVTGDPILLTREEKERIFLDSIQTYYVTGKPTLSDSEFDKLREDLSWEGSALVTLNRNETLFLNAMGAYMKGSPIMSDTQFDDLKNSLRTTGSKIAVVVPPKCYVETGVCKVNWTKDKLRTSSLYVPAAFVGALLWEGVLYEILEPFRSFNPLFTLILGYLPVSFFTKQITEELIFSRPEVASGPCPSCGVENSVFFGDVLGVEGDKEESTVNCKNCKSSLTIKRATLRVSTLPVVKGPPKPAAKAVEA